MKFDSHVMIVSGKPETGTGAVVEDLAKQARIHVVAPKISDRKLNDYLPNTIPWAEFDVLVIDEFLHSDAASRSRIEEVAREAIISEKALVLVVRDIDEIDEIDFGCAPLWIETHGPDEPPTFDLLAYSKGGKGSGVTVQ